MSGINNRVFGSDIENRIKKKLEARQLLAEKNRNPTDPIFSQYKQDKNDPNYQAIPFTHAQLNDLNFNGVADLSSRTPFVRMWTAIVLKSHVKVGLPQKASEIGEPALDEIHEKIEGGRIQKKKI